MVVPDIARAGRAAVAGRSLRRVFLIHRHRSRRTVTVGVIFCHSAGLRPGFCAS
ncbi:TPA: hypothetical protein ACWPCK_002213 [Salmonella enterica]